MKIIKLNNFKVNTVKEVAKIYINVHLFKQLLLLHLHWNSFIAFTFSCMCKRNIYNFIDKNSSKLRIETLEQGVKYVRS